MIRINKFSRQYKSKGEIERKLKTMIIVGFLFFFFFFK